MRIKLRVNLFVGALVISALLGITSGCGSNTDSELKRNHRSKRPFIVAIGGRESCELDGTSKQSPLNSNFYQELEGRYGKNVASSKKANFLVACHNPDLSLSYYSSWDQKIKSNLGERQLYSEISKALKKVGRKAVTTVLIGHSYGGWVAMDYMNRHHKKIDLFYTIDPISKRLCSFSTPQNCLTAPQDISRNARRKIRSAVKRWVNFFQTQTIWLHATAILESSMNIQLKFGHTEIDNSNRVWQEIRKDISDREKKA